MYDRGFYIRPDGGGGFYEGQEDRWNPRANPYYNEAIQTVRGVGSRGTDVKQTAINDLQAGYQPPMVDQVNPVVTRNVNPSVTHATSGLASANDALETAMNGGRAGQVDASEIIRNSALGNGPSVSGGIIGEAGANARAGYMDAATGMNERFGQNATQTGQAYQDALAAQTFATEQAGIQAGRDRQLAAEDAIKRQAALTSAARGGNIGGALLNAQNNAAAQTATANTQASQIQADASRQAAFQAAAGQRQAAANQAAADIQAAAAAERAAIESGRMEEAAVYRAAQIAADEQLRSMGMYMDSTGQIRSMDLGGAQTATGIANTGLGVDTLRTGVDERNADRSFAGDRYNTDNTIRIGGMNQGAVLQTNALNQNTNMGLMGAGSADEQTMLQMLYGAGVFGTQQGSAFDQFYAGNQARTADRGAQVRVAKSGLPAWVGPAAGALGTIGGATVGFMAGGPPGAAVGAGIGGSLAGSASGASANAASRQQFSSPSTAGTPYDPYGYGGNR